MLLVFDAPMVNLRTDKFTLSTKRMKGQKLRVDVWICVSDERGVDKTEGKFLTDNIIDIVPILDDGQDQLGRDFLPLLWSTDPSQIFKNRITDVFVQHKDNSSDATSPLALEQCDRSDFEPITEINTYSVNVGYTKRSNTIVIEASHAV